MGAKYLPTVKDQKASLRFHRNLTKKSPSVKPAGKPSAHRAPKSK